MMDALYIVVGYLTLVRFDLIDTWTLLRSFVG